MGTLETIMIAIAVDSPLETEGKSSDVSLVERIAELSSGASKVENATIGGIGKQPFHPVHFSIAAGHFPKQENHTSSHDTKKTAYERGCDRRSGAH
jgi:hypothetical protein